MKNLLLIFLLFSCSFFKVHAQWNSTGDNSSTGHLTTNTFIANKPNYTADWNSIWQCGIFDGFDAQNAPEMGWFWGINLGHRSNYSTYRYGGQLAIKNSSLSPALYFRSRDVNDSGTWAKVLTNTGDQYIKGNVVIEAPSTALDVRVQKVLGNTEGDYVALSRLQGPVYNQMMVNDFFLREKSGSDGWLSTSYVKGISVDFSFLSPATLKSWIKQFPAQDRIDFGSSGITTMTVLNGKVGINCTNPDVALTVKGTIHAREVIVDMQGPLADYVFEPTYNLKPLAEVEKFVKEEKHLPEMPSAAEVADKGMNMGEMQNLLLQKVEELTLYLIEQQKVMQLQQAQIDELKKQVAEKNMATK